MRAKFICRLTAAALTFSISAAAADSTWNETKPSARRAAVLAESGFEPVAAEDGLELYLNREEGEFAVLDTAAGILWRSSPAEKKDEKIAKGTFKMALYSIMTITTVDFTSPTATGSTYTSYTECVLSEGGTEYEPVEKGFRATYRFVDEGITIPFSVMLEEGSLRMTVEMSGIVETSPNYRLESLTLLPYFGAGGAAEDGYLLVPDGSGALIRFNNGKTFAAPYEKEVYGPDWSAAPETRKYAEQMQHMPVFGLQNRQGGYLGIIEEAAADALIRAETAGKITGFNAVCAKFVLREFAAVSIGGNRVTKYEEKIKDIGNPTVRYYFHSGDGGYSEMAARYRRYLQKYAGLSEGKPLPKLHLNILCAYPETEYFFGFPYAKAKPLTPYERLRIRLARLEKDSVADLSVYLMNWDKGFAKGALTRGPDCLGSLGGTKSFRRLRDYAEERGVPVYLSARLTAYRKSGWFSGLKPARTMENTVALRHEYLLSTRRRDPAAKPQKLLSPVWIMRVATEAEGAFRKVGPVRLSVTDLAVPLYSDRKKGAESTKTRTAERFEEALRYLKDRGADLCSEGANAYALPYLHTVLNAPASDSRYDIEDVSVPFYQLVLNGFVNCTVPALNLSSDPDELFLFALESGSSLCYSLADEGGAPQGAYSGYYGIDFDDWTEDLKEKYRRYSEIYDRTDGLRLVGHRLSAPGISEARYRNGGVLMINRTDEPYESEYGVVPPRGYLFADGEANS